MHKSFPVIICLYASLNFISCTSPKTEAHVIEKRKFFKQENQVDVAEIKTEFFQRELVSNGKLRAKQKSELRFEISERIDSIYVKNGDFIHVGQKIASLNRFNLLQTIESSKIQIQKSKLDLQDILIGQGYSIEDSLQIPNPIWKMAILRSGFKSARGEQETARYKLNSSFLRAPFSGKIANLRKKAFEQIGSGEVFCLIIDDSEFEVEFNVIENEYDDVHLGMEVQVSPFSNAEKSYAGRITEINPIIDDNGLASVRALVKNPGDLIEGMNVSILIQKSIPNQLVVPKAAVVLRQNQEVLFKCTKDSIALWTYVKTLHENTDFYSVIAHPEKGGILESGDTVIISGNLNLAHESIVEANWK